MSNTAPSSNLCGEEVHDLDGSAKTEIPNRVALENIHYFRFMTFCKPGKKYMNKSLSHVPNPSPASGREDV